MILLKMRCTLPHHSYRRRKLVVAGRREVVPACAICDFSIFINAPATALRERLVGASWREGYRWQTQMPFMTVPRAECSPGAGRESACKFDLNDTATGEYHLVD